MSSRRWGGLTVGHNLRQIGMDTKCCFPLRSAGIVPGRGRDARPTNARMLRHGQRSLDSRVFAACRSDACHASDDRGFSHRDRRLSGRGKRAGRPECDAVHGQLGLRFSAHRPPGDHRFRRLTRPVHPAGCAAQDEDHAADPGTVGDYRCHQGAGPGIGRRIRLCRRSTIQTRRRRTSRLAHSFQQPDDVSSQGSQAPGLGSRRHLSGFCRLVRTAERDAARQSAALSPLGTESPAGGTARGSGRSRIDRRAQEPLGGSTATWPIFKPWAFRNTASRCKWRRSPPATRTQLTTRGFSVDNALR